MNHFITLDKAKQMNARYRAEKENILAPGYKGQNILAVCESFDRSAFDRLLAQEDCAGIRIYYGMDDDNKIHAVVVGYDENDRDILPTTDVSASSSSNSTEEDDFEGVVEEGNRCPTLCPPESPLNEDEDQP